MTNANDVEFAEFAGDFIGEDGTSITYSVTTGKAYTPGTSSATAGTTAAYAVMSAPPYAYRLSQIDGDLIQVGDLRTIVPSQDEAGTALPFAAQLLAPTRDITASVGGRTYRVLAVTPYRSGDDVAAYELQLRQGP